MTSMHVPPSASHVAADASDGAKNNPKEKTRPMIPTAKKCIRCIFLCLDDESVPDQHDQSETLKNPALMVLLPRTQPIALMMT